VTGFSSFGFKPDSDLIQVGISQAHENVFEKCKLTCLAFGCIFTHLMPLPIMKSKHLSVFSPKGFK
jgi:hypothetical protein